MSGLNSRNYIPSFLTFIHFIVTRSAIKFVLFYFVVPKFCSLLILSEKSTRQQSDARVELSEVKYTHHYTKFDKSTSLTEKFIGCL